MRHTHDTAAVEARYDNDPATANAIGVYLHCGRCLEELKRGVTEAGALVAQQAPAEYARTQIGITDDGFQVWCNRHDCNVARITFYKPTEGGKRGQGQTDRVH